MFSHFVFVRRLDCLDMWRPLYATDSMWIVPIHLCPMDSHTWTGLYRLLHSMSIVMHFDCSPEKTKISVWINIVCKWKLWWEICFTPDFSDFSCLTPLRCFAHVLKSTHVLHGFCSPCEFTFMGCIFPNNSLKTQF